MDNNVFKRKTGRDKLNEKMVKAEASNNLALLQEEVNDLASEIANYNVVIAPEFTSDMDFYNTFNYLMNLKKELAMELAEARNKLAMAKLEAQIRYNKAVAMSSDEFKEMGITNKEGRVAYAELESSDLESKCIGLKDTVDDLAIDYDEVDVKLKFLLAMVERGRIPKVSIDDAL